MHPTLDILVSSIGEIFVPASGTNKAHWTFGCKNGSGYLQVRISGKKYRVHRLVAETFIPNPENLPTVDHYPNRDKTANMVQNLRWASHKMQADNTICVDRALGKYGVRSCEDVNAYHIARYANDPEFAERERERKRRYLARKKAQGFVRKCVDGHQIWIKQSDKE